MKVVVKWFFQIIREKTLNIMLLDSIYIYNRIYNNRQLSNAFINFINL